VALLLGVNLFSSRTVTLASQDAEQASKLRVFQKNVCATPEQGHGDFRNPPPGVVPEEKECLFVLSLGQAGG
jgi:hypothetical protein